VARSIAQNTQDVDCGTDAMPTTGSLGFWVYPTWAQADGVIHTFFDCRNSSNEFLTFVKWSDDTIYAGWKTGGSDHRASVASAGYTLNQNAWNHFVLTWDDTANETRLYLNGSEIASQTATLVTHTTVNSRAIGIQDGTANRGVNSRVAEFFILSSVLQPGQVTALNGRVSLRRVVGAVQDQYTPLYGLVSPDPDLSGNKRNGTVTGATLANHAPVIPYSARFWGDGPLIEVAAGGATPHNPLGHPLYGPFAGPIAA